MSIHNATSDSGKIYALAIVAHPDDESYLIAGTTSYLLDQGKQLGLICATRGEKGVDRLNRNLSEEQMGEIRSEEIFAAAKIINCNCVQLLDYHDGELEKTDFNKLTSDITNLINQYSPEIIITFGEEGISGHHDHIMVGLATKKAITQAQVKPKELWLMQVPSSVIDKFNDHMLSRRVHHSHYKVIELKGVDDNKLLKLDISKYSKLKLKAIMAHKSQHAPGLIMDYFLTHEYFQIIKLQP